MRETWLRLIRSVVPGALVALAATVANAVTIELKDVASDRVERQRAAAIGSLPLPGTPDLASFGKRLANKGLKAGDAVFIRIFKAESELEVWMSSGGRYVLLDTYPVCHWSGTIGPKIHEGDKQTPEGFYEVTRQQLHLIGRHPRSLNLGFPNVFDKVNQRTGSYILVHGGCSSVGCFAMTNSVVAEIYDLSESALKAGQDRINVHVFPFRMTAANMAKYAGNEWYPFWQNLKEGYDAFEQTRVPPRIGVCEKRYLVEPAGPEEVAAQGPLAVCGESLAALSEWEHLSKPVQLQFSRLQRLKHLSSMLDRSSRRYPYPRLQRNHIASSPPPGSGLPRGAAGARTMTARTTSGSQGLAAAADLPCDLKLASCRKWSELQKRMAAKALAFREGQPPATGPKKRTAARTR